MSSNNLNPEKMLIFDIKGPMAHFRKYYTNSSSLSYLFPPRTVVVGLIAGLLGLPSERHTKEKKDIYYEKFDEKKCLLAISLRSKVRRIMQTVNYSFTKTDGGKIDFSKHSQIPLEILLPENDNEITYRIYFYHKGEKLYNNLKNRLEEQGFIYPPYMGISEFLANIDYVGEGEISQNEKCEIEINSICKVKDIQLNFSSTGENLKYFLENMPTGFLNDRTPKITERYLAELNGKSMSVKLNKNNICYSVKYTENGCVLIENIMFM